MAFSKPRHSDDAAVDITNWPLLNSSIYRLKYRYYLHVSVCTCFFLLLEKTVMNITKLANMQNVMKTLISRASQHSKKLAASPWNRDLHISVMRLAKEPNEDEITSVSERCTFSQLIKGIFIYWTNSVLIQGINQVMLMGRLGSDPVRKGSESHPVATFSLATNSTYGYSSGIFENI